jgi:hypothetical protein
MAGYPLNVSPFFEHKVYTNTVPPAVPNVSSEYIPLSKRDFYQPSNDVYPRQQNFLAGYYDRVRTQSARIRDGIASYPAFHLSAPKLNPPTPDPFGVDTKAIPRAVFSTDTNNAATMSMSRQQKNRILLALAFVVVLMMISNKSKH